jgi:4-amino-4-deoxy-L-arabinose transferase-like glycosyltransferase
MRMCNTLFRSPENALIAATVCKILVILICYQNVIDPKNGPSGIRRGYGWDQLVSTMYSGDYSMLVQNGLSDLYDMRSESYRPPIYPMLLYAATRLSGHSATVLVSVHSIITSIVAYLGYLLVKASTGRRRNAILCMWSLFLFPMNFLKSGSTDEAPLMMVFLLASLCLLGRYRNNQNSTVLLVLSGIMLGLSTMTRYTVLFVAVGLFVYILIRQTCRCSYKHALIFIFVYVFLLVPWVCRNYLIYGRPVLSVGSARLLLTTQSEDFIRSFPYEHMDIIERRFLRKFHESHGYLTQLSGPALDKEFEHYAVSEVRCAPVKFLQSMVTKLKVFIPYRYYPLGDSVLKDIIYVVPYSLTLLFFFWSVFMRRCFRTEHIMLLISIVASILPGLLYFMLSRHLYSIIVLMIVFMFAAWPASHRSKAIQIC